MITPPAPALPLTYPSHSLQNCRAVVPTLVMNSCGLRRVGHGEIANDVMHGRHRTRPSRKSHLVRNALLRTLRCWRTPKHSDGIVTDFTKLPERVIKIQVIATMRRLWENRFRFEFAFHRHQNQSLAALTTSPQRRIHYRGVPAVTKFLKPERKLFESS